MCCRDLRNLPATSHIRHTRALECTRPGVMEGSILANGHQAHAHTLRGALAHDTAFAFSGYMFVWRYVYGHARQIDTRYLISSSENDDDAGYYDDVAKVCVSICNSRICYTLNDCVLEDSRCVSVLCHMLWMVAWRLQLSSSCYHVLSRKLYRFNSRLFLRWLRCLTFKNPKANCKLVKSV